MSMNIGEWDCLKRKGVSKMKTFAIRKKSKGYQVVWFWANSFTGSEFEVENGFFKSISGAENLAFNLEFEGGE